MSTNFARPLSWEECQDLMVIGAEVEAALARVAELAFSMLKQKLGQEKGWSPEFQEEVEDLYRRFLALNIVYPDRKICPIVRKLERLGLKVMVEPMAEAA